MMRNIVALLVSAFVAGCAVMPAPGEGAGEVVDTASEELAAPAAAKQVEPAAAEQAVGGEQSVTCPPPGTCEKANILCEDPEVDVYWCKILTQCFNCNDWGVVAEEPAAPAEAKQVEGGEENLACPTAGQCELANVRCEDPEVDVYWCGILTRCMNCGYGVATE